MESISNRNVQGMFERCERSARTAGVDTTRWALKTGTATYGRSYGVVNVDPTTGGQGDVFTFGQTRRSAWDGLHSAARAFELAAWAISNERAL